MPDNAPEADAREFAAQFRSFLEWIHSTNREEHSEVSTLVGGFLGPDGAAQSVVTRELVLDSAVSICVPPEPRLAFMLVSSSVARFAAA